MRILRLTYLYTEPDYCDRARRTAAHYSCREGALGILELLFAHDADLEAVDKKLRTPLHIAAKYSSPACTEFLLKCAAVVDAEDYIGDTPLHHAVASGCLESVRLLLAYGASADRRNRRGLSPLQALEATAATDRLPTNRRRAILQLLLAASAPPKRSTKSSASSRTGQSNKGHNSDRSTATNKSAGTESRYSSRADADRQVNKVKNAGQIEKHRRPAVTSVASTISSDTDEDKPDKRNQRARKVLERDDASEDSDRSDASGSGSEQEDSEENLLQLVNQAMWKAAGSVVSSSLGFFQTAQSAAVSAVSGKGPPPKPQFSINAPPPTEAELLKNGYMSQSAYQRFAKGGSNSEPGPHPMTPPADVRVAVEMARRRADGLGSSPRQATNRVPFTDPATTPASPGGNIYSLSAAARPNGGAGGDSSWRYVDILGPPSPG